MPPRKRSYHEDFRYFAQNGDKVLNIIIDEICKSKKSRPLNSMFKCNSTLVNFRKPCKFKHKYKTKGKVADEIEAYIHFLDINYGRDAAKRYVYKEMIRIRDMIPTQAW